MTNFEKWHDELLELKNQIAIVNGIPKNCKHVDCEKCDLSTGYCFELAYRWLWEEYKGE